MNEKKHWVVVTSNVNNLTLEKDLLRGSRLPGIYRGRRQQWNCHRFNKDKPDVIINGCAPAGTCAVRNGCVLILRQDKRSRPDDSNCFFVTASVFGRKQGGT